MEEKLEILTIIINYFLIKLNQGSFKINVKISILYCIGSLFYYWSLAIINNNEIICFKKKDFECFYAIAEYVLISSIIINISIYIIFFFKLKKFHLFNIFIIYLFFLLIDHDSGLIRHGIYNFLGFIFLLFFSFILLCYTKYLYFISKRLRYRNIFFCILFFISFSLIFLFFNIYKLHHFSCYNWAKGLNDTYRDNTSKDYPCLINIPKNHSCYLSEIGKFFDISSILRPTCLNDELLQSQSIHFLKSIKNYNIKYYNISNKNYFGYPLTNNDKFNIIEFGNTFIKGKKDLDEELHKNIILMDLFIKNKTKYYPNEEEPEIYVQFKKGIGEIKIKLKKNETLIKEKEKIINSYNTNPLFKNVVVMFFDTLSRAQFFRKFPKTISFFNKFSKYEPNFSKKKMNIFQFFKFNSIKPYTDPNLRAVYYGATINGNGTYFANYFKNQGYILGKTSTYCEKSSLIFNDENNELNDIRWDHEGISISCIKGIYHGLFLHKLTSSIKKCLFGKQIFEYALEYLESFLETYFDYNKMFLFESGEGHEPTGQVVGYLDDILYKFLFKLYSKNYLSNTSIILFSDHGQHLNGLFFLKFNDFFYESTSPILFLIFPNTQELYKEFLYETIKSNQQVFITPYDIYYTLIHIALGDKISKIKNNSSKNFGESLLTPLNYSIRYCESRIYDSQIDSNSCNCKINLK